MNNVDIDTQLREYGLAWREGNADRPAVDWDAVLVDRRPRRRGWFIAAAAVAAVAIPLLIADLSTSKPGPIPGSQPLPPKLVAERGAPPGFFALAQSVHGPIEAVFRTPASDIGVRRRHYPPVAIAAGPLERVGYTANRVSGCRTTIDRLMFLPSNGVRAARINNVHVWAFGGRVRPVAMAVSPDGSKLAMVLTPGLRPLGAGSAGAPPPYTCNTGHEAIAVLDLRTYAVRQWSDDHRTALRSLQWSPDNGHLAFASTPCRSCHGQLREAGSYVLDTSQLGRSLASARLALPAFPSQIALTDGYNYPAEPVFWWHGKLVAVVGRTLRQLDGRGGLGALVARNLPLNITSVSSDPTGNHLLLWTHPPASTGFVPQRPLPTTYRWDNGVLSPVKGNWTQPGW